MGEELGVFTLSGALSKCKLKHLGESSSPFVQIQSVWVKMWGVFIVRYTVLRVCACVLFKGRSNKIVFTPSNNMGAVGTESPLLGLQPEAKSFVSGPSCYKSGYSFFVP